MHFADIADLEQGISIEGQPGFPTPPQVASKRFRTLQSRERRGYLAPGWRVSAHSSSQASLLGTLLHTSFGYLPALLAPIIRVSVVP